MFKAPQWREHLLSSGKEYSIGPLSLVSTESKNGNSLKDYGFIRKSNPREERRGRGIQSQRGRKQGKYEDVTGLFYELHCLHLPSYPLRHIFSFWLKKECPTEPSFFPVLGWDVVMRQFVTSEVNIVGRKGESHRGRLGMHVVPTLLCCNKRELNSRGTCDVCQSYHCDKSLVQTV